jgi:hypothetical protein
MAALQSLGIGRHAQPIVPKDLDQLAAFATEYVEVSAVRVAFEGLMHQHGQRVRAAAHVGVAGRNPHPDGGQNGDHRDRPSASAATAAFIAASTAPGIRMRTPAANSISIAPADLTEPAVAVLAATGYNLSLLLRWFRRLLCALLLILARFLSGDATGPEHQALRQLIETSARKATILIAYDIHPTKGDLYDSLIKTIQFLGDWWHHLESTWIARWSHSPREIRDQLKSLIGIDDQLLSLQYPVTGQSGGCQRRREPVAQGQYLILNSVRVADRRQACWPDESPGAQVHRSDLRQPLFEQEPNRATR